jgi:putative acetyltransferase
VKIVEASVAYHDAIAAMTREAFARQFGAGDAEVMLIDALRTAGDVVVELAALDGAELTGHILFSRATDEPYSGTIVGLAPMCVRIDRQRAGIGSTLVRAGLAECRSRGAEAAVVLGDTDYYGRFGFSAALAEAIACDYAGPHFQALELKSGALAGVIRVRYAPAFAAVGG